VDDDQPPAWAPLACRGREICTRAMVITFTAARVP
jgi:hypothetical protein